MKKMGMAMALLISLAGGTLQCDAQDAAPPPGSVAAARSSAELDQLLGPIALYPDPLIALILPAATFPSQIVEADRYVSEGGDPNQIPQQAWDGSVQGLAHYPNVLKWMDDNIAWTTELGQAFASQQSEVMDSIQRLRGQAQALGNLQSNPQETVQSDDGDIDIEPANPDEIYVPDYQPDQIYYDPGVYCSFGVGFPIGAWLGFDWDWRHHHLISWGAEHPRPHGWWQRAPNVRAEGNAWRDGSVWRAQPRAGRVVVAGGDRGYENRPAFHPSPAPRVPMTREAPQRSSRPAEIQQAPEVQRAPEITRAPEASRSAAFSRPIERSAPESVFGGSQSSREVRESSSRGQESRGFSSGGASHSGGGNRR